MDPAKIIQLKPEEDILMTVRQDLVPLIPWVIVLIVWFILPFFFMFPLFTLGEWGVLIFAVIVLSAVFFAYRTWFGWQRTMFVVTDRRLVDIDQHGFFDRTISELFYSGIDDVSYRKKGLLSTIFGYGNVLIRTTGSAADIEVRRVRGPDKLHDLINDLREAVIDGEPKDPKERELHKAAKGLSPEEIAQMTQETKKKFRKKALEDFFEDEEE